MYFQKIFLETRYLPPFTSSILLPKIPNQPDDMYITQYINNHISVICGLNISNTENHCQ